MKKLFLFSIAITFVGLTCFATVRRVGFAGLPIAGVDYTTLQLAHNASASGDTIYMFPNSDMYCDVSKKLYIFGPGYFLDTANTTYPGNSGLQVFTNTTTSSYYFSLLSGSEGSEIYGCDFYHLIRFNGTTGNILIKRCRLIGSWFNFQDATFNSNCSQITFQQCVIHQSIKSNSGLVISNLSFVNCIFASISYASFGFDNSTNISGVLENCIFTEAGGQMTMSNGAWLIRNCISQNQPFSGPNIIYSNNIGTGTQFPLGNGNLQNQSWASIFNLTGSWDGKYALKAGSPAIGAGTNGIDCGMFGGPNPYRLSGIPPIPAIYSLNSPQGTSPTGNTMQINVSVRSNN